MRMRRSSSRLTCVAHQIQLQLPGVVQRGHAEPQQVSACFILSVDDSMESILNWYRRVFIFRAAPVPA